MAIYKMMGNKERLDKVSPTTFGQEGVLERSDLQRILRLQPDVLEEGLFIVTEEFSNWEGSGRSIDLLALDATGRLVVIELKRGDTGEHMDLQAIRYAAMVSTIKLQQTIDAHQKYLDRQGLEANAEQLVHEHLANTETGELYTAKPRIILLSEGFSPELTTCAMWLNNNGLDVSCIRIQPYRNDQEILIETSQIIPLPEAENYLVKVREREEEQTGRPPPPGGKRVEGSDDFKKAIDDALPRFQPDLQRLFDWSTELEQEGLTQLYTYMGGSTILQLRVPGTYRNLVTIYNEISNFNASVQLWGPSFEMHAPTSKTEVERSIGLALKNPTVIRPLPSDQLLDVLRAAYKEAKGLLVGNIDVQS